MGVSGESGGRGQGFEPEAWSVEKGNCRMIFEAPPEPSI